MSIDPAESEAWVNDLKSRSADGDYFFSLNRYLFLARRKNDHQSSAVAH